MYVKNVVTVITTILGYMVNFLSKTNIYSIDLHYFVCTD